jgi:hypothetical protein
MGPNPAYGPLRVLASHLSLATPTRCSWESSAFPAVATRGSSVGSSSPVARSPPGRLAFAPSVSTRDQGKHLGHHGRRTARSRMARRRAVWLAIGPDVTSRWGARATTALARARPQAPTRRNRLEARSAARGGAAVLMFPA